MKIVRVSNLLYFFVNLISPFVWKLLFLHFIWFRKIPNIEIPFSLLRWELYLDFNLFIEIDFIEETLEQSNFIDSRLFHTMKFRIGKLYKLTNTLYFLLFWFESLLMKIKCWSLWLPGNTKQKQFLSSHELPLWKELLFADM